MCTVYLFFGGMFFRNLDYFIFNEIKPLQSVLLPFCCCDSWIIVGIGSYTLTVSVINGGRAGSRRPTKGNCVDENSRGGPSSVLFLWPPSPYCLFSIVPPSYSVGDDWYPSVPLRKPYEQIFSDLPLPSGDKKISGSFGQLFRRHFRIKLCEKSLKQLMISD